ncbi:MAG: hypothetical protein P8X65_12835 [Syntrophobacterales bacterium]|jgi:hypothetical protein
MQPKLIYRLLIIILCLDLTLALWCLSRWYAFHHQMLIRVF